MNEPQFNPCERVIEYVTGDLDDAEKIRFEQHLSTCGECMRELSDIREVWRQLPYAADEAEPPATLKSDVMNEIFGTTEDAGKPAIRREVILPRKSRARGKWIVALAVAFLAGIVIGRMPELTARQAAGTQSYAVPSQVEQMYSLRSVDVSSPEANGKAWVATHGDESNLVMCFYHMPRNEGKQTYQVWLLNNGERSNAGTFNVDAQGNGVLTFRAKKGELPAFEAIGITLEPDPNGNEPRGKKVLGT
ncbi:anti-sigma factor [Paenibacillus cymbidii]|uniref:anti-sigma factor n=1 Tax=Paenibacillus cymbidii TaxID=1639034 RepID=UPI001081139E|nr:anti-sigma factor [Paenibacillus cymbidii]